MFTRLLIGALILSLPAFSDIGFVSKDGETTYALFSEGTKIVFHECKSPSSNPNRHCEPIRRDWKPYVTKKDFMNSMAVGLRILPFLKIKSRVDYLNEQITRISQKVKDSTTAPELKTALTQTLTELQKKFDAANKELQTETRTFGPHFSFYEKVLANLGELVIAPGQPQWVIDESETMSHYGVKIGNQNPSVNAFLAWRYQMASADPFDTFTTHKTVYPHTKSMVSTLGSQFKPGSIALLMDSTDAVGNYEFRVIKPGGKTDWEDSGSFFYASGNRSMVEVDVDRYMIVGSNSSHTSAGVLILSKRVRGATSQEYSYEGLPPFESIVRGTKNFLAVGHGWLSILAPNGALLAKKNTQHPGIHSATITSDGKIIAVENSMDWDKKQGCLRLHAFGLDFTPLWVKETCTDNVRKFANDIAALPGGGFAVTGTQTHYSYSRDPYSTRGFLFGYDSRGDSAFTYLTPLTYDHLASFNALDYSPTSDELIVVGLSGFHGQDSEVDIFSRDGQLMARSTNGYGALKTVSHLPMRPGFIFGGIALYDRKANAAWGLRSVSYGDVNIIHSSTYGDLSPE